MCLVKDNNVSPLKEVPSPRSPWSKLLNRQILKPRLPRKVVNSTRVNLNKCWSKLGELISNSSRNDLPSIKTAYPNTEEPIVVTFSNFFYPLDPVKPGPTEENDNMENQNIINNRYELITEDLETTENLANEAKESCHRDNENCKHLI